MNHAVARLALGRILRLASRSAQEGDTVEYFRCRELVLNALDSPTITDTRPNWTRDRLKGAQGDA